MYDSTMVPTALHIILTSNSMWHLSTVRTGVDMTLAKAPRGWDVKPTTIVLAGI